MIYTVLVTDMNKREVMALRSREEARMYLRHSLQTAWLGVMNKFAKRAEPRRAGQTGARHRFSLKRMSRVEYHDRNN